MSLNVRRSARFQASIPRKPLTIGQLPSPEPSVTRIKRKATAITSERNTKARKVLKTKATTVRRLKASTKADMTNVDDTLLSLPPEIFDLIIHNITNKATLSRLSRTSKTFQALLSPRLYSRVSVDVTYHSHIAKFIRNIEPHLSIRQRKQLKKEGKYRGQQDDCPSNLGPKEKPACAGYVRQLSVNQLNPGRKHAQILYRYIEEALQNMRNIEVLDFDTIDYEIAQGVARLEKLQALSIYPNYEEEEFRQAESDSLKQIKNLRHLRLGGSDEFGTLQALLLNSGSTLESLDIIPDRPNFWERLETAFKAERVGTGRNYDFPALKSLTISGYWFQAPWVTVWSIRSLKTMIDFTLLRELTVTDVLQQGNILFEYLANLYSAAGSQGTALHLRKLSMDMSFPYLVHDIGERQMTIDSQIRFLSSFQTLTSLHIKDYGKYSAEIPINPGLPDAMMQAILKHNNLDSLGICYCGIRSGEKLPYLSATAVATLIDNLPKLKLLEIAPEEDDTEALGQALERGTNLESIVFSSTPSWASHHRSDEPNMALLEDLLKAYLSRGDATKARKYRWEDYCKLRSLTIDEAHFQIASKFKRGGRGIGKQNKFNLGSKPAREVMYRDVSNAKPSLPYEGFSSNYQWLDKVCGNLD